MTDGTWVVADRYGDDKIKEFYERGWWRKEHLSDHLARWADEKPDARFVSDGERELTYGELFDQVGSMARSLARLGVQPGERVVCQLPNWSEFVVLYLALGRIGAVLVPIMPMYRRDEAEYVINHSEAVMALTTGVFRKFDHQGMFRDLQEACPTLRQVIVTRAEAGEGEQAFDDLVSDGEHGFEGIDHVPDPDDVHLIVYTSGTESKPKGCCHTWNTFGFSARGLGEQIFRLTADDVVFMPSPIAHSTGLVVGVAMPMFMGAATHLLDVWEPNNGLKRIQEYGCTVTATATPFVRMSLDTFDPSKHDISSMRFWLCAGAPIPPSAVTEVSEKFEGCNLVPLYGCSEVLAAASCTLDDPVEAVTSSDGGPALDGVEIRLGDQTDSSAVAGDDAKELSEDGAEGEILYRGPGSMLGYWRDPERTASTIDKGNWYHSSDLGKAVDGRYVRVTGRIKDLVIRGGTNISAREVEEHVDTHPKVQASAIVGYPDERLGEKACAFVVLAKPDDTLTLDELGAFLRDERHIAMHKLPERLEIIDELPMGATGKVQKFQLREKIVPSS